MTYSDITTVQQYLGTTFDGTTSPTLVQVTGYIADADTEINNITGTVFGTPVSTEEIISIDYQTDTFVTSKHPISGTVTVYKNTATDKFDTPVWEEVDSYNDRFKVKTKYTYVGDRIVKLSYSYGFATTPPEVEYLATLLVAKKILSGESSGQGSISALGVGSISLTFNPQTIGRLNTELKEYTRRVGRYKRVTL
jgi:hypothetical protein